MAQREAVTKTNATRYKRADKAPKGLIVDELCATTGWHRHHARKALSQVLTPRLVRPRPRAPRRPIHGAEIIATLAFCWRSAGRCWAPPTREGTRPVQMDLLRTTGLTQP